MKLNIHKLKSVLLFLLLAVGWWGCDSVQEDVLPRSFEEFKLYPDDFYEYNEPDVTSLLRLDPLTNDSIKVPVTVSFTQSKNGRFVVDSDGYTNYTPNGDYVGKDSLTYTVCSSKQCKTEKVRITLEALPDPANCVPQLVHDEVETRMNQWVDIRIHMNDVICDPYNFIVDYGWPLKGEWWDFSYSGPNPKNVVLRYYPPQNYVGADLVTYKVYTSETEYLEATVTVTIKP